MASEGLGVAGMVMLFVALGMWTWNGFFYGDDAFEDNFGGLQEPNSFLNTLEFLLDLVVAVSKSFADIVTFQVTDAPEPVQNVLSAVFGLVFGLGLLAVLISLVA